MPVRGRGAFPTPKDATTFREHSQTIAEYRALKRLDRSAQALELLRRVGQAVRPIMLKHKWHLPLLVEMYPKTDNLLGLNVNRGQKIALRLRRPYDQNAFIDEEAIVETMLHELTHNIRGPHDDVFFHHLDILTQEWYDVRAGRHLPGQGFAQPGHVLGGGGSGSSILGVGPGRTLGGSARTNTDLGRKEAAANAAERRRRIVAGCPSNDSEAAMQASQEQEQQERLHGVEVIVLDDDDDDERGGTSVHRYDTPVYHTIEDDDGDDDDDVVLVGIKKGTLRRDPPPLVPASQIQSAAARHNAPLDPSGPDLRPSRESTTSRQWTCQACTLSNALNVNACIACGTVRPGVPWWTCRQCNHKMLGGFADLWCCSQCGVVKIA